MHRALMHGDQSGAEQAVSMFRARMLRPVPNTGSGMLDVEWRNTLADISRTNHLDTFGSAWFSGVPPIDAWRSLVTISLRAHVSYQPAPLRYAEKVLRAGLPWAGLRLPATTPEKLRIVLLGAPSGPDLKKVLAAAALLGLAAESPDVLIDLVASYHSGHALQSFMPQMDLATHF